MSAAATAAVTARRLRRWQFATIALGMAGYAGYYVCRSDYSVALPLLVRELGTRGVSPARAQVALGLVASAGVMAYALGKFPAGWIADRAGGRRNFLGGMAGSVAFTLLFAAAGGLPLFTLAWIGNRLAQSLGWGGLMRIVARWFSGRSYGTVCAVLSLSFLFGDAAARAFLALLLGHGIGWRGLFEIAAACLAVLLAANWALLREAPGDRGLPEPAGAEVAAVGETSGSAVAPLLALRGDGLFWLACLLSAGMTVLRESFNTWTPAFFTQAISLSPAEAALRSALFPLLGGVSVLLVGMLSDRFGERGRAVAIVAGMLLAAGLLAGLASTRFAAGASAWPVALVAATGFAVIGPYSMMAGAVALDLGGKRAGATASGVLDGFGYLGSVAADPGVALVSVHWGWRGVFVALAGVALLTLAGGLAYGRGLAVRRKKRKHERLIA